MNGTKILVVDDEPQIRRVMRVGLSRQSYEVTDARSGEEALEKLRLEQPDLILLDLNMAGIGGLETCREIRRSSDVLIVVLSVKNSEEDKVRALDAGADDYVTKPFGMDELLARIRAALRRVSIPQGDARVLALGDVEIDFEARRVSAGKGKLRLTPKEFDLLRYLVAHAGQPITHRRLLQAVWGPDYGEEVQYLRVFINQLRKKLESDPSQPKYILTEPWVGYRFVLPPGS
ncbi:MAG: response regulator transcription factor [Acidobacteria bacterium]|nr:response regulator transcription factor [Acidobacteriota bacterium]